MSNSLRPQRVKFHIKGTPDDEYVEHMLSPLSIATLKGLMDASPKGERFSKIITLSRVHSKELYNTRVQGILYTLVKKNIVKSSPSKVEDVWVPVMLYSVLFDHMEVIESIVEVESS